MSLNSTSVCWVNRFFTRSGPATGQLLHDLLASICKENRLKHRVLTGVGRGRATLFDPCRDTGGEIPDQTEIFAPLKFWRQFEVTARFWKVLRKERPDIVVLMSDPFWLSCLGGLQSLQAVPRLILWIQDIHPEIEIAAGIPLAKALTGPWRKLRKRALGRAAHIVVPSDEMKARILAMGGSSGRVTVLHNWFPGEAPISTESATEWRRREGLEGKFLVGYSGNLGRIHSFDWMPRLANALRDRPDVAFVVSGGGARYSRLRSLWNREGPNSIRWLPFLSLDDFRASLGAIDLHLASFLPEFEGLAFPSKVYGPLWAGRPVMVVGNPEGELGRFIRDGAAGAAFPSTGIDGMANFIRGLASSPEMCQQLGGAATGLYWRSSGRIRAIEAWKRMLSSHQSPTTPP